MKTCWRNIKIKKSSGHMPNFFFITELQVFAVLDNTT